MGTRRFVMQELRLRGNRHKPRGGQGAVPENPAETLKIGPLQG